MTALCCGRELPIRTSAGAGSASHASWVTWGLAFKEADKLTGAWSARPTGAIAAALDDAAGCEWSAPAVSTGTIATASGTVGNGVLRLSLLQGTAEDLDCLSLMGQRADYGNSFRYPRRDPSGDV